jgi:hypothetical protein
MAFAPSFDLVFVPSRAIMVLSMETWSHASKPTRAGAILDFTFATALRTPFPEYLFLSPSRSSMASNSPVEAPEGTAARPKAPEASLTSTYTVGLPRESMISRAVMKAMDVFIEVSREWERRS